MKAICTAFDGIDDVTWTEVEAPHAGEFEVEVEVKATALNRADLLQVCGLYPAPEGVVANIPGLEYAGEVVACGKRVTKHRVGARVFGLVAGGAFAQRLVTHEDEAMAIPDGLDFVKAAAVPEAFLTAWDALSQAKVAPSEWVLIHAVASGVGTAAVQLVKQLGAKSIGTSRTAKKLDGVRPLGLDVGLALGESFAEEVRSLSNGGVNAVVDLIGGEAFAETLESMAFQGRLILVGLVAGPSAQVPLRSILRNRLSIVGTAMRTRKKAEKAELARDFSARVLPWFSSGLLKPVIDDVMPIEKTAAAMARMASNETIGKLVLTVS